MAKISPVSIKYMIYANFRVEGALEKPDVIGAIFGQTEGLLGSDLEMRELQKEGKIGRIEVELERKDKKTMGTIQIPTALDQSETTLIAAAVETIERVGPTDAQIEIEKIEDVRGSKRDYIIERAKKLMQELHGTMDSREISREIKEHTRVSEISEYGEEKLPCGDLSGKEITLFVDGDRGGKLIARNVVDNARIKYIAVAPDGKEVEELMGKEALMALRKKSTPDDFFRMKRFSSSSESEEKPRKTESLEKVEITPEIKEKLRKISNSNKGREKAIILDENLNEIKSISPRALGGALRHAENPFAIVIDGVVTGFMIDSAEEARIKIIVASNFGETSEKIQMLSL